ncbi:Arf guanine nucleotide exchange factor sbh1 [Teratosphaeriaceae sp. CCFEE 6253]|nr:Arf guanine nucleotide exchange factor sbh1 [Teratosphaeriaceae sp. CCFEE 6253]
MSSPRPSSPVNSPSSTASTTGRPSSPKPPGGPATAIRRRAAADRADKVANARPSSTRAAGAGGSSSTMLSTLSPRSHGLRRRARVLVQRPMDWSAANVVPQGCTPTSHLG